MCDVKARCSVFSPGVTSDPGHVSPVLISCVAAVSRCEPSQLPTLPHGAVTRVRRWNWAGALWGLLKHPTSLGFHLRKVIKVLNQRRG